MSIYTKRPGEGERILSLHQQSLLVTRHGRLRPSPCPGSGNLHYCSIPERLDHCHPPPHAAPPDSDGLETIPTCRFHSKWEFCSIHHFYHNYFQLSWPFRFPSDRRLQATTLGIFLPVAYFCNMDMATSVMSKLLPGEETSNFLWRNILFSLAFSSNLHRNEKHPTSSQGLLFWHLGFSWNVISP